MTTQKLTQTTKKNGILFRNKKIILHTFCGLVVLSQFSLFLFQSSPVYADTISNNNYSIDVGTIDTNPQPTEKPKPQSQVLGIQTPKPEFTTGPDYTVNTSNNSFSVQFSQNSIDYGILSSTNPVIRTSTISFSDPTFGAEILAYENHPLFSSGNAIIQNTNCDNGACSSVTAALWNNTLTYGFGYRCDSQDQSICDQQFSISNYFKQYPDDSLNELAETVMDDFGNNKESNAIITDKVNISGTQKTGSYNNNITYLAVPNF
jgi:hypothetical protein